MKRASSTCRQRKLQCENCGYVVRVARSWLEVGLPCCPCGGTLEPTDGADRAIAGLIGPDDVASPVWTAICRANGWDDSIKRRGAAAKAYDRKLLEAGGIFARETPKPQCAFPGCGKWTASGAEHCHRHDPARVADPIPF